MCSRDGAEISDRGYVGGLAWATAVKVRDDDACADDDDLYAGDGRDTKLGSFEGRRVPSKCFSTVIDFHEFLYGQRPSQSTEALDSSCLPRLTIMKP